MTTFDPALELSAVVRNRFFVDGGWVLPTSKVRRDLVSPVNEKAWIDIPLASAADVDAAIAAARKAFDKGPWPRLAPAARAQYLERFAREMQSRVPLFTRLWTAQVGAPVSFAAQFAGFAPYIFNYYASSVEKYAFESAHQTLTGPARVRREPLGVAALIMPWNAPLPIVSYKLAAALAAGCTVVIKSPPETPFDALVIAEAAAAAGLPPGTVNVVTADRDESAYLVSSPLVDKVSFTGSTAVGQQIARTCIDRMARFTLELGGKSAAVILEDADINTTLAALAPFTIPFSGQVCFAQTRIIAPRTRIDELVAAYSQTIARLRIGDPWSPDTHVGPMVNAKQMERTLGYIAKGREEGARLVLGGTRAPGFDTGYFVAPTVFADVRPGMTVAQEEIFGPVVCILEYGDVDEAIALANDSRYGLSGSVFGRDPDEAYEVAKQIRTGHVSINGFRLDPSLPFGGVKHSGVGREGGPEGIDAFVESKAVYLPASVH